MSNKFEVSLSFKPIMDGLTRFASAIEQRMERVRALNLRLENGAKATNQLMAQAATVLGVQQLGRYVAAATAAEKAQRQLIRAMAQQGVYSKDNLAQLNEHSDALERVTNFEGEEIMAVQRQLISYKVARKDLAAYTEAALDLGEALGTGPTAAAVLMGKTLKGEQEELGRYGIQIDQTKQRSVALLEAVQRFAGGQSRAGVAFPEFRQAAVEIDQAQKALGRAVATNLAPLIAGWTAGLGTAVGWISRALSLVREFGPSSENLRPIGEFLGRATIAALALLAPLLAIRAVMVGLPAVINPARMAFVALFGVDMLDAVRDIQLFSRELGIIQTMKVANWGQRFAAFGAVVSAAFAGWQIGNFINELEVGGMKIGDWTARALNLFMGWSDLVGSAFLKAWTLLKFNFLNRLTEGRLQILEFVDFVAEKLNKVLPSKWQIPTDGVKEAIAAYKTELGTLDASKTAALLAIEKRLGEKLAFRGEVDTSLAANGRAGVAKPGTAGEPVNQNPTDTKFRDLSAELKAREQREELERQRQLFGLETAILEAQANGDQALVDRLTRRRDAMQLINDLGIEAINLIEKRITVEEDLRVKQKQRLEEERALAQQIADIAERRALIEADRFLTTEEKQARVLSLLREENALIDKRIASLKAQNAGNVTDEVRQGNNATIDQLRGQRSGNAAQIETTRPLTFLETMRAKVAEMETQLGSFASRVASAFATVGDSIRTSMGGAFADMILKGQNFKEAALGFGNAVLTSFVQNGAQMAADELYRLTILKAWRSMFRAADVAEESATTGTKVAIHAGGETAKTGASAAGTVARKVLMIGETIFHGIQWTFRTAAHLAGEVANTAVTIAQKAIRLPLIIAESGAYLVKAGIGALSAMASIPYVGPILAVAAMGAILAAGGKLLGAYATGGLVSGPGNGTSDSIVARLSNGEFVNTAATVQRFGPGFFEGLEQGVVNLPSNMAAGLAQPYYPTGGGGGGGTGAATNATASAGGGPVTVNVANFYDLGQATAWLQKQQGVRILNRVQTNNRSEFGLES